MLYQISYEVIWADGEIEEHVCYAKQVRTSTPEQMLKVTHYIVRDHLQTQHPNRVIKRLVPTQYIPLVDAIYAVV